jgi:general secretion pathway protein H
VSAFRPGCQRGFTLLELLVVIAIMAMATSGVSFALRDSAATALEREALRLSALLESARAQSRLTGKTVMWRATPNGFVFEGLLTQSQTQPWLSSDIRASVKSPLRLGPEPIIGPQSIQLALLSQPGRSLTIGTDGVRPFAVTVLPTTTQDP